MGLQENIEAGAHVAVKRPALMRQQAFIAGHWCDADSGETMAIIDPATQRNIGHVPLMGGEETTRAIAAAVSAQRDWERVPARERAAMVARLGQLMVEQADELAVIMTLEQGKPLHQARQEVVYGASYFKWYAAEAPRITGAVHPVADPGKHIEITKIPIGVTAAITPWNFPIATVARKLAPALAVGCAQIVKPAPTTPFTALAIAHLAERVGCPAGLISVLTGDAAAIGAELTSSADVRMLSFTGSTAIGRKLYADCASTIKKVALELGGNAPFLVFEDADLDAAVDGLMTAKFRNMGQVCIAPNRVMAHESVFDDFRDRLREKIATLTVGPGLDDRDQGPLATQTNFDKVRRHVKEALERGATLVLGGGPHELGGWFYQPTILTDVPRGCSMTCEETFGPVVALSRFANEKEAIATANDTPYGLAAYFYTSDVARERRIADRLQSGMVGANCGAIGTPAAPFGGIKQSGIGREGSTFGLEEFLEAKYICRPLITAAD
ncbi:NAD-dependent succinate-semialdehyde dehydrogenase [Parasphingopyxis algicola]|uniref:NAD-dependent succinate-semialdehyde dehydrogenase n=1 Tax=Parasphingopyxis algicola TaxID=2026624 RepID=UPI0015A4E19B|nr:NAD-dependent succinate-semialdehyde dehydrogenase [Parasphingopyxis algicola]QLC23929.1 NAD-dependent succinate-semialdehyde dehydrogenase [Parasphingopyxis algicola]